MTNELRENILSLGFYTAIVFQINKFHLITDNIPLRGGIRVVFF